MTTFNDPFVVTTYTYLSFCLNIFHLLSLSYPTKYIYELQASLYLYLSS